MLKPAKSTPDPYMASLLEVEYSVEAELAYLGCLVLEPKLLDTAVYEVNNNYFHIKDHGVFYDLLLDMRKRAVPIETISINDEIKKKGLTETIKPELIIKVLNNVESAASYQTYKTILTNKYYLRFMKSKMLDMVHEVKGEVPYYKWDKFKKDVDELICSGFKDNYYSFSKNKEAIFNDMKIRMEEYKNGVRYSTTLRPLDKLTNGLHTKDLIIIGGRPSNGKTSLATQMAYSLSKKYPVIFFTTEMSEPDLRDRIICCQLNLNYFKVRIGKVDTSVVESIQGFVKEEDSQLYINFCPNMSFATMKPIIDKIKPKFIFMDYIQQIKKTQENFPREMEEMCRDLKNLAGEIDAGVIVMSQLNRGVEKEDREPKLSDLSWSGGIENSADLVLLVQKSNKISEELFNTTVFIAKQRNGPTGPIPLIYNAESMRFFSKDSSEDVKPVQSQEEIEFIKEGDEELTRLIDSFDAGNTATRIVEPQPHKVEIVKVGNDDDFI